MRTRNKACRWRKGKVRKMATRIIRVIGDTVLNKTSKTVTDFGKKTTELVEDMLDTMYEAQGVGLAAPQVGILKRIVVIDVSEEGNEPIVLINPEIIETSGEQRGAEGCLSVPGKAGEVVRPNVVKVRAQDLEGNWFEIEGEELLARAFCHEIDHLNGVLYTEHVIGELVDTSQQNE